jgi:hypothetical protein
MAADELWFHRKRGLPRWERIGHPLDTLTVVLCLAWILSIQPTRKSVIAFVMLAAFSCFFVTKDEPIHWNRCSVGEQWLHSMLFMLHPLVLASAAFVWPAAWSFSFHGAPYLLRFSGYERTFLTCICGLTIGFGIYQFLFWNLPWRSKINTP